MRRGEILALRWEHVNLGVPPKVLGVGGEAWEVVPGWLLIEKSKSGRPRTLPMSGKVRNILRPLYGDETRGDYVFQNGLTGSCIADIKTGFTGACRRGYFRSRQNHGRPGDGLPRALSTGP